MISQRAQRMLSRDVRGHEGKVDRMITAAHLGIGPRARSTVATSTPLVLRRIKRLTWFGLVACVALVGTLEDRQDLAQQLSVRLALAIILVASWAIVIQVSLYLKLEEERRQAAAETARLDGARLTASAMQDRIANKLSLTVGYAEFLVTDPRLPEDLREHAQRAMDGARAAADQMSELKRLTRQEYEVRTLAEHGQAVSLNARDAERLRGLMAPLNGDPT